MRIYYYIIFVLTLIGCSASAPEQLKSESIVINTFEDSEIRDLSIMLKFFDEQICSTQQVDTNHIAECYKSFFKRLSEDVDDNNNIEIKIPFSEQLKMYENISESTFTEIWTFGKSWRVNSPDTLKCITLKYGGKYAEFLRKLGEEDEVVNNYYKAFEVTGGSITPGMVAGLLKNYESYDVNDIRIRLIVAVHYLTLNDEFERKEKISA